MATKNAVFMRLVAFCKRLLLNKEKEVIFESDDVTEVIDKAKELFGQCERNMINNHIKSGLNFEHFIC